MQFDIRAPNVNRLVGALTRQPANDVPYFDSEFAPGIVSSILEKPVRCRSHELPPGDYIEFARRIGLDGCYLTVPWWLGRTAYVDEDGVTRYTTGELHLPIGSGTIAPPETDAARKRIEAFLQAADTSGLGLILALPTAAHIIASALGYERYFTLVCDDPGLIDDLIARCESLAFQATERLLSYRPAVVFLGSFACFKTGLCMAREMTERFILQPFERHVQLVRGTGVPVVMHCDGNNSEIMDRWIEMGVSGIHPVEPCGRCDIYEYKRRWGDLIALCGNIDCTSVLSRGTPGEVTRDTVEHLTRLSPGGGYVCGSSHDVGDNIPIKNLQAMAEAVAR